MLTHLDGTAVSCLDLSVRVAGLFINGGGGVARRPQVKGPTNQRAAHAGLGLKGKRESYRNCPLKDELNRPVSDRFQSLAHPSKRLVWIFCRRQMFQ